MIFISYDSPFPREWKINEIESVAKTIEYCQYCKDGVDKKPVMNILHGIINQRSLNRSDRPGSIG
jgi:hypothetical protein